MKATALLVLAGACSEPVVGMHFVAPANADRIDTSCVTAVEVRTIGDNFRQDSSDYRHSCYSIANKKTFAEVSDEVRGEFKLSIPDSGLAGIQVFGWAGPDACKKSDAMPYTTPDVVFFGKGEYEGQDSIDVQGIPNLNCTSGTLAVRLVDMFALIASGNSSGCAAAMTTPDNQGWAAVGTLTPKLFGKGAVYYGGMNWANVTNNLSVFQALTENLGSAGCVALDSANQIANSTGCMISNSVCADPAQQEVEAALIKNEIVQAAPKYDPALKETFPGMVFASVWSGGNTTSRTPVARAFVDLDPAHGKAIYIDPPDASNPGQVKIRSDQSTGTGPSGLVMLYIDSLAQVRVTSGAKQRIVTLGATDGLIAGAMIVMP